MLQGVADRFGRLDVLVNNAGTFVERDFGYAADAMDLLEQEVALPRTSAASSLPGGHTSSSCCRPQPTRP
jgi:short-subunit dehydrogenase involved in D-alanine esterification of teichoic acids